MSELPRRSPLATGAALLVLTGFLIFLDGWVGALVGVAVAAVFLARLPRTVLGAVGTLALLLVPVVVLAQGVPSENEVSPAFVSQSLVPHHLLFVGMALLSVWVVLDLVEHQRGEQHAPDSVEEAPTWRARPAVALALVILVAVGAVAASVAVITL